MTKIGTRIPNQTITLRSGEKVFGKNIRVCTQYLFECLGGTDATCTVGIARVDGQEIPVTRTRGRSKWVQAGVGERYDANGNSGYSFF